MSDDHGEQFIYVPDYGEDVAQQLVTAALIARDETMNTDYSRSSEEAKEWLVATAPLTDLVEAAVDHIEDGDIDFGQDLIYELVGFMATAMEQLAKLRQMTGLDYWKAIQQQRLIRWSDSPT